MKIIVSFLVIVSCVLISCSHTNIKENTPKLFFPALPDKPKIQFLKTISSSRDIEQKQSDFESFIVGSSESKEIIKPYGICSDKDRIIAIDTKLSSFIDINLKKNKLDIITPIGFGKLRKPLDCQIDQNSIYVNDIESKEILIFDSDFNFKSKFGSDILEKPSDFAIYDDRIYVCDMPKNQILIFDKNQHKLISQFPNVSVEDTSFLHSPTQITIKNNKIFIVDFGEFNIKVFDLNGNFLKTISTYGQSVGQLVRPKGLAADNTNNLYVLDAAFENAQIFDNDGKLLMYFGGAYQGKGFMYLPIKICIDYQNLEFFEDLVDPNYKLKYLIYVTNQFGPDKITVYGFIEEKN